jgi:single-stranded DNA-binding protein
MRFGTTGYFLGIVKLVGDFKVYYTRETKNRVVFCEALIAPARPKSRRKKPLTRVMIYFFGSLGNQAESYYKKGDYVLAQGRLKLFKRSTSKLQSQTLLFPIKEYRLNVIKMSLIHRS